MVASAAVLAEAGDSLMAVEDTSPSAETVPWVGRSSKCCADAASVASLSTSPVAS